MSSLHLPAEIVFGGNVKIWQDAPNTYSLLFQRPHIMASLFGVGLPCALLNMRREGQFVHVFVTQLSYTNWLTLWKSFKKGAPRPCSDASDSDSDSSGSDSSFASAEGDGPDGSWSGPGTSSSGSHGGNQGEGGLPVRDGGRSGESGNPTLLADDEKGVSTLRIKVAVGNKPGEGIATNSRLIMARNPEHKCDLGGQIEFLFSELQPPIFLAQAKRRKMEVNISARYHLPGCCLVERAPTLAQVSHAGVHEQIDQQFVALQISALVGGTSGELGAHRETVQQPVIGEQTGPPVELIAPPSMDQQTTCELVGSYNVPHGPRQLSGQLEVANEHLLHVGIVHDDISVNFHCTEVPLCSTLIANEALDMGVMDLTSKEGGSRQRGWDGGLAFGGHSVARADLRVTRASSSMEEIDALSRSNVIAGTRFQLWNMSRMSADEHLLSYTAVHKPPIDSVSKLEEVGLDSVPKKHAIVDVALPVDLKCRGEFLLTGSGFKKHRFEMSRTLGEFQIEVQQNSAKKLLQWLLPSLPISRPSLLCAKQNLEIEFIVNHEFELSMYRNGHLYWLLVGNAEPSEVPHVLDVHREGV